MTIITTRLLQAGTAFLLAATAFTATALPASAAPTARASGAPIVYDGPGSRYRMLDRLDSGEIVYLDECTRHSRWCHVVDRESGPDGWVLGSYLVGSPAKVQVTPFSPLVPFRDFMHRPKTH